MSFANPTSIDLYCDLEGYMFMESDILPVLKMLAAKQISAQSAERILQALELLREEEKTKESRKPSPDLVAAEQQDQQNKEVMRSSGESRREEYKSPPDKDHLSREIQDKTVINKPNAGKQSARRRNIKPFVYLGVPSLSGLVLIVLSCLLTYTTIDRDYKTRIGEIQSILSIETARAALFESKAKEYKNTLYSLSKKGTRKPLGIFNVTAYDPVESCKPFDDGFTAKAIPAGMGVAAVDPKVIPYGSVIYIPEINRYFFASDTGTAIKSGDGRNIDLLMPTVDQALQFGRKRMQVELIDLSEG
jgi:3D (Asp-Asp-Asp) domain-containing protein